MPAEWYYTTNQQQMGPVSWQELCNLVNTGSLKPNDLVWSEGMEEWVKASQQKDLFAATDAPEVVVVKKSSYADDVEPFPRRSSRRRDQDDDGEEDDEKVEKRTPRKRKPERAGMSAGVKIGLILGGGLLVLGTLACCVVSLVLLSTGAFDRQRNDGHRNYTISNLRQTKTDERRFTFQQGRQVTITVTNTVQFPNTDVDLHVYRGAVGQDLFAADEKMPPQMHCRVEFLVPVTDTYRVQVRNLGPGTANSCVVSIVER